LSGSVQPFLME